MAKLEDLKTGTRVRVTSRGGATGTVEQAHTMDNTVSPPRPLVHIKFDGAGHGLNYPEQCEVIDGPACSCAVCIGAVPWTERFPQCIQLGWITADRAVAAGIACPVPLPD